MSVTASLSTLPGPKPDRYWTGGGDFNALRSGIVYVGSQLEPGIVWANLGAVVSSSDPGPGIAYSSWTAGSSGFWLWIRIP